MDKNKTKENIILLNVKLMHSIDVLINAYNKGYEFFKEKKPDGGMDNYYAAVLSSFVDGVVKYLMHGGDAAAATSEPIMVAVAAIKYLNEHPEFKANLMF